MVEVYYNDCSDCKYGFETGKDEYFCERQLILVNKHYCDEYKRKSC
jgi:hypothetical protein